MWTLGFKERGALRRSSILAFLAALGGLISCHANTAPTPAPSSRITVTVNPATVSLNLVTSRQFQYSISGSTNPVVIWKVNDVTGGNTTVGLIDSLGFYFAPAQVPSPATVTVTAVSSEDKTASGSAMVTILAPPQVTVSPTSATVAPAGQTTFTSTVTGAPTTNVTWEVNNIAGGNSTFGTINSSGSYTAPLSPPPGGTVTVTALSADYPHPPSLASATVTISSFAPASFQGLYAFSLAGRNASGPSVPFFRAGSFRADGAGHITGGLEDIHEGNVVTSSPLSFVGAYTLTPDGRGTMQFNDGHSPANFAIAMVNNGQVQIIGSDASGTSIGQANLQDLTAFKLSALLGTYVFDFTGLDSSSKPLSQIGEFTADGGGLITNGSMDVNDNGTVSATPVSFTGSYQADPNSATTLGSNGRLLATLHFASGDRSFALYMVSRGSAKFVEIDTAQSTSGIAAQQAPNVTFNLSSLSGSYAFLLSGSAQAGAVATAGSFSADGNGHITSGMLDESSSGGTPLAGALSAGASYTLDPLVNGRGTVTFTAGSHAYNLVFYLSTAGNAVLQETDSGRTSDGSFVQQQSTAFSLASIQGSYALHTTGFSAGSVQTIAGQVSANGMGAISSGAIDINPAGTTPSEAVSGMYSPPASNGRATLTLNPPSPSTDTRNFAVYVVNSTQVFLLGIDNGRLAAGSLFRQF
jgi:hypothetical protein